MPNRVAAANDAIWALLQAVFSEVETKVRNPHKQVAPKARGVNGVSTYIEMQDGRAPEVDRVLNGPIYDLRLITHVIVAFLGPEESRRDAATAAVERLKNAILSDFTLGGAVEYACLQATEDAASSTGLEWMAGGVLIPVRTLFSANSQAG